MQENPYTFNPIPLLSSPETTPLEEPDESRLVSIRQKHIAYEDSILGIGIVLTLGGAVILLIVSMLGAFAMQARSSTGYWKIDKTTVVLVTAVLLGFAQLITGAGISRFNGNFRIPGAIACIPWIFSIVGTLPSIYFIYLLLSPKGLYVFTDEYKAIAKKTAVVKCQTSFVSWIVLAVFMAVLALFFGLA